MKDIVVIDINYAIDNTIRLKTFQILNAYFTKNSTLSDNDIQFLSSIPTLQFLPEVSDILAHRTALQLLGSTSTTLSHQTAKFIKMSDTSKIFNIYNHTDAGSKSKVSHKTNSNVPTDLTITKTKEQADNMIKNNVEDPAKSKYKEWFEQNKKTNLACYMKYLDIPNPNIIGMLKSHGLYKKVETVYLSFHKDSTDNTYKSTVKTILDDNGFPDGDIIINRGFSSGYMFKYYWLKSLAIENNIKYFISDVKDKSITDKLKINIYSNV